MRKITFFGYFISLLVLPNVALSLNIKDNSSIKNYASNKVFLRKSLIHSLKDKNINYLSSNFVYEKESSYFLGYRDQFIVEILGASELNKTYEVPINGYVDFPRLGLVKVSGKTLKELKEELEKKYEEYIYEPSIVIFLKNTRPKKIFIEGEVARPGFYTFQTDISIYETIQEAEGFTPFADLRRIKVIRKLPDSQEGKIATTLNFIPILNGNEKNNNIQLMDGDVVRVIKAKTNVKEQIFDNIKSNIFPDTIKVYVSGRVNEPGIKEIPNGSTLYQLISLSGGVRAISGKIELSRLSNDGKITRKLTSYNQNIKLKSDDNPILLNGDVIRVRTNAFNTTSEAITEITAPFTGIFSLYNLINVFN